MNKAPDQGSTHGGDRSGAPGRWYTVLLLIVIAAISNVDRNIMGIVAEGVRKEFDLSDGQVGLLAGLAFALPYAIASIPMGMLADRFTRKRLLAGLLAIWSAATALSAFASSFAALVGARVIVGTSEAGAQPTSLSMIGDLFPKEKRATVTGLFFISSAIGMAISFGLGGVLAQLFGWRSAFLIVGAPGLILSLVVLLTLREPVRGRFDTVAENAESAPPLLSVLKFVVTNPTTRHLAVGAMITSASASGVIIFLSPFLLREHEVQLGEVGLISAMILGSATLLAAPVGGWISDKVSLRFPGGGLMIVAVSVLLAIPCLWAGILTADLLPAAIALFMYIVFTNFYIAPTYSTFIGAGTPRMRGLLAGLLLGANNLAGYGLGPVLIGVASDIYKSIGIAQPLSWALMTVTTICALIASLFYLMTGLSMRRQARIAEGSSPPPS